jgi:hypothetical protein
VSVVVVVLAVVVVVVVVRVRRRGVVRGCEELCSVVVGRVCEHPQALVGAPVVRREPRGRAADADLLGLFGRQRALLPVLSDDAGRRGGRG